jgi:hypothetical protein
VKIGPELDWLSDDNRAGLPEWKGRVHPSHPKPRSRGYPERLRMSALELIGRNAGGHGEAGMESEEGTAFESLPRRKRCRSTADQPFLLST